MARNAWSALLLVGNLFGEVWTDHRAVLLAATYSKAVSPGPIVSPE